MLKISPFLVVVTCLVFGSFNVNAASAYKCVVNGVTTYQQEPCPSGKVRKPPTVEELNAAEKKRRAVAETVTLEKSATTVSSTATASSTTVTAPVPTPIAAKTPIEPSAFRCDGRRYCSQMKSCAEANYFLANCPGVKMDGDKDGIPCEEQWCTR